MARHATPAWRENTPFELLDEPDDRPPLDLGHCWRLTRAPGFATVSMACQHPVHCISS